MPIAALALAVAFVAASAPEHPPGARETIAAP